PATRRVPMTLFGLVRHGQTDYNLQDLFQGSSDIPLNATGIAQAHAAFDDLPDVDWDVVISSPLQRAEQTARIICEDHALPFGGTDPRLVEIDWGAAEGQPVEEMERTYPGRSFPGREEHQAVADRGYDALEALEERFPGQKVLLVAHGTLIRFLLSGIIEQPLPSIPNDTLSLVELAETTSRVRMIEGQSHRRGVRGRLLRSRAQRRAAPPPAAPVRRRGAGAHGRGRLRRGGGPAAARLRCRADRAHDRLRARPVARDAAGSDREARGEGHGPDGDAPHPRLPGAVHGRRILPHPGRLTVPRSPPARALAGLRGADRRGDRPAGGRAGADLVRDRRAAGRDLPAARDGRRPGPAGAAGPRPRRRPLSGAPGSRSSGSARPRLRPAAARRARPGPGTPSRGGRSHPSARG